MTREVGTYNYYYFLWTSQVRWHKSHLDGIELANAKKLRIWLGSALTNPSATQVGSRLA